MADLPREARRRGRRLPVILAGITAIGAAKSGLWLYFRNRQPLVDALTRRRLEPRGQA